MQAAAATPDAPGRSLLAALPYDVFVALATATPDDDVLALSLTCRTLWGYAVSPPSLHPPFVSRRLLRAQNIITPPSPQGYTPRAQLYSRGISQADNRTITGS